MDAGRRLALRLKKFQNEECVVVAVPRGGVILGEIVALELGCPLDLMLVRKIGHPYNLEYAVCAVSESSMKCSQEEKSNLNKDWLQSEVIKERSEIERRKKLYLGNRKSLRLNGKTVILVDDGVATGLTYLMAVEEIRSKSPDKIVAALPVMPEEYLKKLEKVVDEVVCLSIDSNYLGAVGSYYDSFPQVEDQEVIRAMDLERREEMSKT